MGVIAKHKNKISLYFHSDTAIGKQARAYVESSAKEVLVKDLAKENLSGTQWVEIASGLGKSVGTLIDKQHPNFVQEYGPNEIVMEEHNWLKVLDKHPEVVRHPILIVGSSYHEIATPSDITKYIETDSAAIEERDT